MRTISALRLTDLHLPYNHGELFGHNSCGVQASRYEFY
jgi:hypothetical protein